MGTFCKGWLLQDKEGSITYHYGACLFFNGKLIKPLPSVMSKFFQETVLPNYTVTLPK